MSTKSQQPLFDRGQTYIRSLTSVVDSDLMLAFHQPTERGRRARPQSKRHAPPELQDIYNDIIQQMSGEQFESAIHATAAIEQALQELRAPADTKVVDESKCTIRDSHAELADLDEEVARDMTDFIHEQAQQWEEGEIKEWLEAFPGEQGR